MDETYLGARRIKGKREPFASGRTPVSGILQREEKVYTEKDFQRKAPQIARVLIYLNVCSNSFKSRHSLLLSFHQTAPSYYQFNIAGSMAGRLPSHIHGIFVNV